MENVATDRKSKICNLKKKRYYFTEFEISDGTRKNMAVIVHHLKDTRIPRCGTYSAIYLIFL